jgi:hypothetical protein
MKSIQSEEADMARIGVVHTTEYTYRNPVGLLRHKLMVRPDESHDLRLHSAMLEVEPEPSAIYWKQMSSTIPSASWNGRRHSEPSGSAWCRRLT